jgi:hypothetical protein
MKKAIAVVGSVVALGLASWVNAATPSGGIAHGGGTYSPVPGILSQFQFSPAVLQCKIGHTPLPTGGSMQMFMKSFTISSFTVDLLASAADVTGTMLSETVLHLPGGQTVTLIEDVPFAAHATDQGGLGAGHDTFSVTISYADGPGLDQFDLFGSPATFSGTLLSGNVVVH